MGTNEPYQRTRNPVNRRNLRQQIERQRDVVIDREIFVDDCRRTVDRCVDDLREAVRERDRAAAQLEQLIELHDEIEAVSQTFGPEIAALFGETIATPADVGVPRA